MFGFIVLNSTQKTAIDEITIHLYLCVRNLFNYAFFAFTSGVNELMNVFTSIYGTPYSLTS